MTRSSKHYRAPTRVRLPNHLPVIFNTARLRSASSRVRRLAQTVLRVYVHSLLLLLAVRSCVQLIGHTAEAVKTLATDPNQSNLSLVIDQSPDECPLTEVIDDCLSSLFEKWVWHGPGDCDVDCPQVAVNASDGHLNTCLIEVPLQDTLQNQIGPVGPEGTSGQCQLPLPVASYSTAFKTMFHGITFPIDFILWHTTVVTLNMFVHMSLILYEFGPPLWTMNRETWRKLRKASSLSGKRGISCCRKTWVFLCVYVFALSTHYLCMAALKRFKHQTLSKRICRQLIRIPSLGLGRGVRCGQRIHGRFVTSFTVQKSFVKRIRSRPSTFCHASLRRAACIGMWLTEAVFKPYIFLRGLLLLAGDIEQNPGPLQEPMSPWNEEALKSMREKLGKLEMGAAGMIKKLERSDICSPANPALGFLSQVQLQVVESKTTPADQMNKVIDFLLQMEDKYFDNFWKILEQSNFVLQAKMLREKAKDLKRSWVEGGGGGGGEIGEGQVKSFFVPLRNFYKNMTVVQDEWLPADQSLPYVNLALATFKLSHRRAHEMFVNAVKEGVDNVYTDKFGKIQCEEIPKLAKKHKTVVISGAPGVGKSTIARKVCKYICQAPDCHGYILVLLVELRDLLLFEKDFQLVDILQLFQGEMRDATTPVELFKAISSNKGKDVLFILDGFDELPPHLRQSDFLVKLLSHNLDSPLRDCDVVLTSRSIVTSVIYHHMRESRAQVSLANIEVLGFTRDQIKEYAGHYFKGQGRPDLLESFVSKIDAIPQVRGLCSIPVVLSIICQVFSFKEDLPPTLTEIYNDYMCIKVLKYHDLTSLNSILDLPRDHDFYKLGKIAFACIQSQKMVFESSDLQGLGERFSDRIKGCGVLTARPVRADPKSKKVAIESFYFIHLTVQEFIAAVYVSLLPAEEQCKIWSKYLGEPHMAQVWRFYCGLTRLTHYELLQANITRYREDFQMQCLFESQNASLVQKLMPHIVGEEVTLEPKTAYDSTAYGYCLSKHPALKELTIKTGGSAGSAEIHRLLEPVYARGTLETLCLGRNVDWRQVEDLFDRIRNCDGALKGHFGKVYLRHPPLSVAVKLLCLQHVREVECEEIQGCEAMDHELLKEMEKALGENKTLEKLKLTTNDVTLPKEFCRSVVFGIGLNASLLNVDLYFDPISWDCPNVVPADIHGSVQHVILRGVPVDVLPKLFLCFSQVKDFECRSIRSPQEAMDHEVLKEMEKALGESKTLETLLLSDDEYVAIPKEVFRHLVCGIQLNASLSAVNLNFEPFNWDCLRDVPADIQGSVQHVTLRYVREDVLPRLFMWFSQVKHLECHDIPPLQENTVSKEDVKFTEVEQALSGMGRLEKLVLGIGRYGWSDSLMVEFGVSVLKGISGNRHLTHFFLYYRGGRSNLLHNILDRMPTDVQRHFIIGKYTHESGLTLPCISRSASGPTHHPLAVGAGVSPAPHGHECTPPPPPHPPSLGEHAACGGTSQDSTDEGGIFGDGGAASKRDVTDGDDTDDRAYTSAEGQEDDGDHTPSPSQSTDPLSDLERMRRAAALPLPVRYRLAPFLPFLPRRAPPPGQQDTTDKAMFSDVD